MVVIQPDWREYHEILSVSHLETMKPLFDQDEAFADEAWSYSGGAFRIPDAEIKAGTVLVTIPWESASYFMQQPKQSTNLGRAIRKVALPAVYRYTWATQVIDVFMQSPEWKKLRLDSFDPRAKVNESHPMGRTWAHYAWYLQCSKHKEERHQQEFTRQFQVFLERVEGALLATKPHQEFLAQNLFTSRIQNDRR